MMVVSTISWRWRLVSATAEVATATATTAAIATSRNAADEESGLKMTNELFSSEFIS